MSDKRDRQHAVMTLDEIKRYVDRSVELRNYGVLSFLGGEPLMHPDLDAGITYAKQKGLGVGVYTNGVLLTKERAQSLKSLGVDYIYAHVDRHQGRGNGEDDAVRLREHFCDMFREMEKMQFGFGIMLDEDDLQNLDRTVAFCQKNSDVISFVNFALLGSDFGNLDHWAAVSAKTDAFQRKACVVIAERFGFDWTCYLGSSVLQDKPGKIMNYSFYQQGKFLGSVTPKSMEYVITIGRQQLKKYPYGALGLKKELEWMTKLPGKVASVPTDFQMINVSLTPILVSQNSTLRVNHCDACTDTVLYKDGFFPMCLLEYVKSGKYDSERACSVLEGSGCKVSIHGY